MISPDRVAEASAEWVYLPEDARSHAADDYSLIAYPESWVLPTQVTRIRSDRPAAELIDEVSSLARSWGRPVVSWWIAPQTVPKGLERELVAAGARLQETVTVLALDLTGGVPDFAVPDGIRAEIVTDETGLRSFAEVNRETWDGPEPTDEQLTRWRREAESGESLRAVGWVDGVPAAAAGVSVVDDVARLWGGATLSRLRGRGAYRAVLQARLAAAREQGATLGLVKGRVETSAPILLRLGFEPHGEERAYALPT